MLILKVDPQLARLFFSLCVDVTPKPTQMNAWQGQRETGISHRERVIDSRTPRLAKSPSQLCLKTTTLKIGIFRVVFRLAAFEFR
jgi:hypothetical protein